MPAAFPGVGNSSRRTEGAAPSSSRARSGVSSSVGLDPDSLCVPDHDRHPHAGRLDRQFRQFHDLLRLCAQLRLLVEFLAVELPVHTEVVLGLRLVPEALHRLGARSGDRLVGRDAHTHEPGSIVQWFEHARERDRAAVRVGDDAVILGCTLCVHLRHDQRDTGLEPVRRRLVDDDCAPFDGKWHELP